jgi:hypothetical protein
MPKNRSFNEEKYLRYIQQQLRVSRNDILETMLLYNVSCEKFVSYIRGKLPDGRKILLPSRF